jgi:hypothetical protein
MTHHPPRSPRATINRLIRSVAILATGVLTTGAALTAATPSQAGTVAIAQCGDVYDHWGQGFFYGYLPYTDGSYGFQGGGNAGSGARLDPCNGSTWALNAEMTGSYGQAVGNTVRWRWQAPPDTTISAMNTRYRFQTSDFRGDSGTSGAVGMSHSKTTDPNYIMRYNRPGPQGAQVVSDYQTLGAQIPDATFVDFWAQCDGVSFGRTCPAQSGDIAQLLIYGATFTVDDTIAPTASSVTGSIADSRYWRGVEGLTVAASDRGMGVFKAILQQRSSDGTWTDKFTQTLNAQGGKCEPTTGAGNRGPYVVFTSARPCPLSATGDLDIDTRTVPEGESQWRVLVSDATDNRTTVSAPQSRIIDRTAPKVTFAATPDSCTTGERVIVQGDATDALAGIQAVTTLVVDAAGKKVAVNAADGTIACPAPEAGPLAVTTDATDKAGNTTSVTRAKAVAVKAAPVTPPTDPVTPTPPANDGAVGGGNSGITDTVTPIAPETRAPEAPKAPDAPPAPEAPKAPDTRGAAAAELLACTKKGIVLTEAFPSGKKDVLRGVAGAKYVGQTVTIVYGPKGRVVSRQPVGLDGSFTATVKAPSGKGSRGNAARYQAIVGTERSASLKRVRRMYATQVYRTASGGAVYVAGRITKPFKANSTVTIQTRSAGCGSSAWRTVKRTKVEASGSFGASFPVASKEQAVVVRAIAQVKASAKTARSSRTQTMPSAVLMR